MSKITRARYTASSVLPRRVESAGDIGLTEMLKPDVIREEFPVPPNENKD